MTQVEDLRLAQRPLRGVWRSLGTVVVLLLATAAAWFIWAAIGHRRLQTQLDAIAALHQPFHLKEFATPPVPDSENAAVLWQAAFAALPANDYAPSSSNLEYKEYPPFPPKWHQMEDRSVVVCANLLALAHRAAAAKKVAWDNSVRSTLAMVQYSRARETANILADAILDAHLHNDDGLALQRAEDLLQLGRAEDCRGTVIDRLVGIAISSTAVQRLLVITPDLDVTASTSDRIRAVIRLLLDQDEPNAQRIESVDCDRMNIRESMDALRRGNWLLGPMIDLSEARMLAVRKVDRLAAEAPSEWETEAVYKANNTPPTSSVPLPAAGGADIDWAGVYEQNFNGLALYIDDDWKVIAERRCAAIALAIRLYRADHGHWPTNLDELVPAYLPAVPRDPFVALPIQYVILRDALPNGLDRPMLFFGSNRNPASVPPPVEPAFSWYSGSRSAGPQFRDLARWRPAPAAQPPATMSTWPLPSSR